ncbi:unnamed protein product [Rhizoctonia solani]|uniref:Uncharacterized protein n=1 Tax=Rhizoctonia solani TaxID=456999 RepID=A0A8H2WPT3_9AGAM|nr:unnamed protein product [Rhizoctonia solani]
MIVVSGMNVLACRSCVCIPVRTFAAATKPGVPRSGSKKPHPYNKKKGGNNSKHVSQAQAQTVPAPVPVLTPKSEPAQSIVSFHETLNTTSRGPHIPLPSPNPPLSSYTLTPEKLRALIDLYHSSTNYITPETLSSTIDETFAPLRLTFNTRARFKSYWDLVAEREELDSEPDRVVPSANELGGRGFGTIDSLGGALAAGGWSVSKGERARMVKAALWGVDPMAKIGLETLLEAKVELDAQDKEQKE